MRLIRGIVKTPTAVSINEIGRAHKIVVIAICVDSADVGRVLGVHDASIALVQKLAVRAVALRGYHVKLIVPQKGDRR
jgi:predicted RNA-binding protein YlqC (UPF0109 family)